MRKYILALAGLICALTSSAFAGSPSSRLVSCDSVLQTGVMYSDWHAGPTVSWAGSFEIEKFYACRDKVCFLANMGFENYSGQINLAVGEMSGSTIRFRRFVDAGNFTQYWVGRCGQNGVEGQWVNETQASDHGPFQIYY